MLESFRKLSQHVVFKVLFGLLLVSFALSGLTGLAKLNFTQDYIVKVGNTKITQADIDTEYDRTVRNIRASGLDFTEEQLMAFGISKPQILRSQIQNSLIRQEVRSLGLEVSDDTVADKIKNIADFQTDGKFDREKFTNALAARGLNETRFLTDLHTAIKNDMLLSTIKSNIPVSDYVAKQQAKYNNETRDIEIAVIPKQFRIVTEQPTEKDLQDFYNENSFQFQIPETRDISYFMLPKKDNDKATYDLSNKIEDELAGGSNLKEITTKLGLKLQTKQDVSHDDEDLSPLFLDTAFGKEKGQASDLVLDEKNGVYFVIEVQNIHEARIPDLKEVRAQAVKLWQDDQTNNQNLQYIEEMTNALKASKQDLQSFASSKGYRYQLIRGVKRTDTEQQGARLVNDGFDAQVGDVIGSFQNEDGTYKIAKLKAVNEPAVTQADIDKNKTALAQSAQVEILDQYLEYLKKEFPVKQNSKLEAKDDNAVPKPQIGSKKPKKKILNITLKK